MRRFWQLLREAAEALEGPEERRRERLQGLKAEVQAQLAFPGGEDPVGRALRLGREALGHLVEGDPSGACRKLREALGLHPGLGRGQAYRLLKALAKGGGGPVDCQVAEGELRELEALLAEAQEDRALALSRLLRDLPPWFWEPLFRDRSAPHKQPRHPTRPSRAPSRPRHRVLLRYVKEATSHDLHMLRLLTQKDILGFLQLPRREGYWTDRSGQVTIRQDVLRVAMGELPERFLLLLKKPTGTLLLPGASAGEGWTAGMPMEFLEEVDLEVEVWAAEDLTAAGFKRLLQGAQLVPWEALRGWLEEGIQKGVLRGRGWRQVLRAVLPRKPEG